MRTLLVVALLALTMGCASAMRGVDVSSAVYPSHWTCMKNDVSSATPPGWLSGAPD